MIEKSLNLGKGCRSERKDSRDDRMESTSTILDLRVSNWEMEIIHIYNTIQ